jgi:hypothetical protein
LRKGHQDHTSGYAKAYRIVPPNPDASSMKHKGTKSHPDGFLRGP